MHKVNLAYLYGIISLLHTCTHVVPCSTSHRNRISPHANINLLGVMRHGHWISPCGMVYTMRDLAMEACCTIQENNNITGMTSNNNSLVGKCVVANYMYLDNNFSNSFIGKSHPKNTHICKSQHETILTDIN